MQMMQEVQHLHALALNLCHPGRLFALRAKFDLIFIRS